jgi:hypothetical protein
VVGNRNIKARKDRYFGMKPWSPHDLRRTARTNMARVGISDEVGEEVVNHTKPGVVGVYNKYRTITRRRMPSSIGKVFCLRYWKTSLLPSEIQENRQSISNTWAVTISAMRTPHFRPRLSKGASGIISLKVEEQYMLPPVVPRQDLSQLTITNLACIIYLETCLPVLPAQD